MSVCVGLCVLKVAIFEASPDGLEDLPLGILARKAGPALNCDTGSRNK